jgi:vinculin
LITVAKRITLLMAKLSELVKDQGGNKKDLIATSKLLADESLEITRLAKLLAENCSDKRIKNVFEKIKTFSESLN